MSFTRDVIANIRYQLEAMRVDDDPTLPGLTITVDRDNRNGRLTEVSIVRRTKHQPAPAGVLVREELDNQMPRP